jgi:beta-lactamase class A
MRRLFFLIALSAAARAQTSDPRALLRDKLARDLRGIAEQYDGVLAAQIVDLTDSTRVGVNESLVLPQGSAIKIPILIALMTEADKSPTLLAERHEITAAEQVGGSGVAQSFTPGASSLSLGDLATLMIALSDNTATNILIERLGMANVNRTLAGMGLSQTKLQRLMIHQPEMVRGQENLSTAAEAASIMQRIASCNLPMSSASCARLTHILELPKDEPVRSVVPADVRVASKPGDLPGVATSWAYVELPGRPFVLTVMTSWGDTELGHDAIRRIARLSLDYFTRLSGATPYGARVPLDLFAAPPQRRP